MIQRHTLCLKTCVSSRILHQVYREAILLWRLHNPHIVRCYGLVTTSADQDTNTTGTSSTSSSLSSSSSKLGAVFTGKASFTRQLSNHIFLVMERCDMDLAKLLSDDTMPRLTLAEKLRLAHGIACGMRYLHWECGPLAPVIHGDLKPQNVLVNIGRDGRPKQVKVCDFGISNTCAVSSTLYVRSTGRHKSFGSPQWLAPEVCEVLISGQKGLSQPRTREVDVYAFGVLLYELMSQEAPFSSEDTPRLPFRVFYGLRPDAKGWLQQQQKLAEGGRAEVGAGGSFSGEEMEVVKQLVELMASCWAAAPDDRPSFQGIGGMLEQMVEQLEGT